MSFVFSCFCSLATVQVKMPLLVRTRVPGVLESILERERGSFFGSLWRDWKWWSGHGHL